MATWRERIRVLIGVLTFGWSTSCLIPEGLSAVTSFDAERYLGKWYEIRRLPVRFENGVDYVYANYSKIEGKDGVIRVHNSGRRADGSISEIYGEAKFAVDPTVGQLKVSFFKPFWGGYNIIALDKDNYEWAMVSGSTRDMLWILSRAPQMDESVMLKLIAQASDWGFDTSQLYATVQAVEDVDLNGVKEVDLNGVKEVEETCAM
uniref:Lipocalin/cytosolic fatty-acid binding domain-containing protein n=1 Tax=Lankesteria abbotti TaxID=340204 RepID=A0A7S2VTP1_9APIC|mmetsp:Transcript_1182/g.1332  ORF Transcript_1182/g.1332 Transcript_1182/m.1332 type:complete len:205 (+) Transcript_1182:162-776(+)